MPLFSVVVPCYNKANVISITINSVLAQTYSDYEIIIVDDGSTDDSIRIINSYQDSRIRLIKQNNSGVSITRNKAIEESNGVWIAFLDADDWWQPDYLKSLKNMSLLEPEISVLTSNFSSKPTSQYWPPLTSKPPTKLTYRIIDNIPKAFNQNRTPFFTSSVCVRRKYLMEEDYIFAPNISNGEDLDLWFRLGEKHKFLCINFPLVIYRTAQESSLSQIHFHEKPFHLIEINKRINKGLIPAKLIGEYKVFEANHYIHNGRKLLIKGSRLDAILLTLQASAIYKTKRFWFHLIATLFLPKKFMEHWLNKQRSKYEQKS